jgi:hypothetical protein
MLGSYHHYTPEQTRRRILRARCGQTETAKINAVLECPAAGHSIDGHPYTLAMTGDGKPVMIFAERDDPEAGAIVVDHAEPMEHGGERVANYRFVRDPDGPRQGRVVYYYRA